MAQDPEPKVSFHLPAVYRVRILRVRMYVSVCLCVYVYQVHVSEFCSIWGSGAGAAAEAADLGLRYTRSLCDVLIVQSGGASELYALMLREIKSAGGPLPKAS